MMSTVNLQGLLVGICLGVTLGLLYVHFLDPECEPSVVTSVPPVGGQGSFRKKREVGDGAPPPLLRPRYVSTELGLRKKVLIGVILSDASATGLRRLLRLNLTLTHTVDKVIFFVNGTTGEVNGTVQRLRSLGLGIVPIDVKIRNRTAGMDAGGAADYAQWVTHHVTLRALKYFGDKFRNSFDYFYLTLDQGYVSGRNLMESLKQISVREEVLWGIPKGSKGNNGEESAISACKLESGFVVSRNVLSAIWNRLGRCWSSAILRDKLGGDVPGCLEYVSPPGQACKTTIQGQVYKVLSEVSREGKLGNVIWVGPVGNPDKILEIHQSFCRARKLEIDAEIANFRERMLDLDPKVPQKWRRLTWPLGLPPPIPPRTRFDVNRWTYFTASTIYFRNGNSPATALDLAGMDQIDVANILAAAKRLFKHESQQGRSTAKDVLPTFQYGYKRFSPTRGLEYILDFDLNGKRLRVEGLRPLTGTIEIVPVPFTTEGKRLFLIVPITRANSGGLSRFLDFWFTTTTDSRQNSTNLVITILQGVTTPRGPHDVLLSSAEAEGLRDVITAYNNGSRRVNRTGAPASSVVKVGFAIVSLRATTHVQLGILDHFGKRGLLGMSTVVIFLEPTVEFKDEFLNRVRMNTIPGYQLFSPIPFMEYHPEVSKVTRGQPVELNKETGYFNSKEFRIMSFYYADYVEVRKSLGDQVTKFIGKVDDPRTLLDIFVHGTSLHVFRGTDPNLTLRSWNGPFKAEDCRVDMETCTEPLVGSKVQLAKILMAAAGGL